MITSICLALLLFTPEVERGYRPASVHFSGPLNEVVFHIDGADVTHFVGALVAGEERELIIPFPELASRREPKARIIGSGQVEFRGWLESEALPTLPGRLSHRTRPPVAAAAARIPTVALLLLLGSTILALSLRRRPWGALTASVALGLAAGVLTARDGAGGRMMERLVEGDSREEFWIQIETARGEIACGTSLPAKVEISPAGNPVRWTVRLGPDGEPRYSIKASAATLSLVRKLPGTAALFDRQRNDFAELEECWIRAETGGFKAHGPWKLGLSLPAPQETGSSPPGWLASGLPQGVPVLLGRMAERPGFFGRNTGSVASPAGRTWLRLTAFY